MSRILLADDSPQALRLAEQILTRAAMEVVSVTDGAVALRRLPDVEPDLLITDVFLPSQSGFDLARFLRSQSRYAQLPIIFAAGPTDEFNEQDARNAGADEILRKPFEASALLQSVGRLLDRSAAAQESKTASSGHLIDRNTIRAAVTLALDSALPTLVEEITERVQMTLHRIGSRK